MRFKNRFENCYYGIAEVAVGKAPVEIDRTRTAFTKTLAMAGDEQNGLSLLGIQFRDSQTAANCSLALNGSLESPDKKLVLKGTRLYDQASGNPVGQELSEWRYALGNDFAARCMAVSRDGKFVAIGAGTKKGAESPLEGTISVWEISTGRRVAQFHKAKEATNPIGRVESVGFSEDGKTVYYRASRYKDVGM